MDDAVLQKNQARSRMALAAVIFAVAAYLVHGLAPAVAWATVIAIGLDPLRRRMLTRMPGRETLVAAALTLLVALVVLVPLAVGVTQAAREAHDAASWLARARIEGVPVPAWIGAVPLEQERIAGWWQSHLSDPEQVKRMLSRVRFAEMAQHYQHVGASILHRVLGFSFIVLSLFFMLRDRDALIEQSRAATQRAFGPAGPELGGQILASIRGTIDGVVLVGLAQGAVMAAVFLAAGVPHPIAFALLAGVGAMVPLGIGLVSAIAAFLVLVGGSPVWACTVIGSAFAIHFVAEHFFKPALIGGSTKLPFLLVLLGLVGGLETLGLLGLFIGPAVMAAGVMIWRRFVAPCEIAGA